MTIAIIEHEDQAAQGEALAAAVQADMTAAAATGRGPLLVVPGGKSPAAFLAALAKKPLHWPSITVAATDERWVPHTDPRSNEAMIVAALGGLGWFFPFFREGETPKEATRTLAAFFEDKGPITSALIGMGEDMHCASLFPGAPELVGAMAPDAPLVASVTPPGGLEPRVTLTRRAFAEAGVVRLLISGEAKRRVIEDALSDPDPMRAPVAAVLLGAARAEIHWAP